MDLTRTHSKVTNNERTLLNWSKFLSLFFAFHWNLSETRCRFTITFLHNNNHLNEILFLSLTKIQNGDHVGWLKKSSDFRSEFSCKSVNIFRRDHSNGFIIIYEDHFIPSNDHSCEQIYPSLHQTRFKLMRQSDIKKWMPSFSNYRLVWTTTTTASGTRRSDY